MQFNEKLKELRTKKGVSQSELADGIYVSRSAVAKWENGLGLPSTESLRLLAEYFGVGVDELCADSSTEKAIVNKNQIISRSRKLLIIISTACAVAITAIIILAIFLGYHLNKPAPHGENEYNGNNEYTGEWGVRGELYEWEEFDDEIGFFTVPQSKWSNILSELNVVIAPHEIQLEKYTLTAGQDYILKVAPSPSGWNGREYGIKEVGVGLRYNTDIFDIVFVADDFRVYYKLTVKQSCKKETIWLYRKSSVGEQITKQSVPSCKMIIEAVAPSEEQS
ncbi:MAG: helix-turn-helix domain-containing protein [Clostridiales bacterium]|nr:helix-turn-helix domain-containing protein [Clostridiales bacterium]